MELKEWKEKKRKKITLKSGLEVQVRQLSPYKLAELGPIPQLEDVSQENQIKSAVRIVQAGVISPVIGEEEDQLSLVDLSMEDINEIVEAVVGIGKRPEDLPLVEGSSEAQTPS